MKISKLEWAALGLTAIFLAFSVGWLVRGGGEAPPIRIETAKMLSVEERTVSLPASTVVQPTDVPTPREKIDINTADASALQRLPGIGEKRAADIVADRAANGPFRIPEDLTRVKGIGEGTLETLLDYITVGRGEKQ